MKANFEKRRAIAAALAAALTLPVLPAAAQSTVRMIVPNAPGSSVDALVRTIANPMGKEMGLPVVVENLPGAGGVTGTTQLVRAPKDGLTLGMVSNNHVVNPSIYKSMPFDSITDITPISVIGGSPFVLVAHPSVPAKDVKELVALAKAQPGQLNYGSSGNGTILHLAGEAFKSEAGVDIRHVPYRGTGGLTTDLLGGQIQLAVLGVTGAAPHIKSGKLRAIGVTTATRSAILPEVPTIAEQGLPGYKMEGWIALIAPAGLPQGMANKIYSQAKAAIASKEVQEAFAAQGFTAIGSTPEASAQFFQAEMERYAKLVKQSGANVD
ncbi:MAG: tripartite tricarboxylate transporter substrate binding protein [Noviherbaspirillum sp.]